MRGSGTCSRRPSTSPGGSSRRNRRLPASHEVGGRPCGVTSPIRDDPPTRGWWLCRGMTVDLAQLYGNRFLTQPAPATHFPDTGMTALDAMRLLDEDLAMEGDPQRNLATFVT